MTRNPDINSKLDRLTFIPVTYEDKLKAKDFKKLCNQDGLQVHDLMLEAIDLVFKAHHWPPGNPQLTLQNYQVQQQRSLGKCSIENCETNAFIVGFNLQTRKELRFCKKHFDALPLRFDVKLWKWKKID